jgi:hypothetical protein
LPLLLPLPPLLSLLRLVRKRPAPCVWDDGRVIRRPDLMASVTAEESGADLEMGAVVSDHAVLFGSSREFKVAGLDVEGPRFEGPIV